MPVVIRLMRAGAKKRPFYRLVAADSRRQRDGRFLEILGHYNPIAQPTELVVSQDKVKVWLEKGAQPSVQVASLLRSLGIAMGRPSKPRAGKVAAKASAKSAKRKHAKKRVVSERKQRAKVTRARRKTSGTGTAKAAAPPA